LLRENEGKVFGAVLALHDITERKALEVKLRHSQKLEAVGQLAAGIAHEINTPAQFIGDNLLFLADSFRAEQELLAKHQEVLRGLPVTPALEQALLTLKEAEEAADHGYVKENAPAAFVRTSDGIARIATIVNAMKEFAHPDQREKISADLNHALDTTLTIARNEYRYVADIETDFGELPQVACHLGDLNQVFLNLLVNAAHAIVDMVGTSGKKGRIRVSTRSEGDVVRIEIADTGSGIPESIRDRVFEPFFTTKEVGRGSGQGLAIARSVVVDKHGGSLTFESEIGKGTTFAIVLPIDRVRSRAPDARDATLTRAV
jgi:signal transduction histidine kinase